MYTANALGIPFSKSRRAPGINLDSFTLLNSDGFERTEEYYTVQAAGGTVGTIDSNIFATDTGEIWSVVNGVWSRDANGLYLSASGGSRRMLNYVPKSGKESADGIIEAKVIWYGKMGLLFRFDGNAVAGKAFFAVLNNANCAIILWDFDAWAETVLVSNTSVTLTQGQEYVLRVELSGQNIVVKLDGNTILSTTHLANVTTGIYHGLYSGNSLYTDRWKYFKHITPYSYTDVLGTLWDKEYVEGRATLSTTHARTGTKSLRMELNSTDTNISGSKRCGIAAKRVEQPREEHWYMFSIYLPAGGSEDYALDPESAESIVQWHQYPDTGDAGGPAPLYLATRNGRYSLRINSCTDAVTTLENVVQNFFDLGSYVEDKGKWVDWAFHVRWGWLPEHTPLVEIFKNGKRIFRSTLPNAYNDIQGTYQKLEVYKWDWADNPENSILTQRVVYYDNFNDYIKLI
jgi:hypothetical protein